MRRELDSFIGCRTALYRFACHLDLDPATSLFAVRQKGERAAAGKAKVS